MSIKTVISKILEKLFKLIGKNNPLFYLILNNLKDKEIDIYSVATTYEKIRNYILRLIPKVSSFPAPVYKKIKYKVSPTAKFEIKLDVSDYTQIRYYFAYPDPALRDLIMDGGNVFIDVGANIGIFSLLAAQTFNQVYSFEPLPIVFKTLSENIELHNNIKIFPVAASNCETLASFNLNPLGTGGSSLEKISQKHILLTNKKAQVFSEIQTNKLDNFMNQIGKVDFIKIDVEGHEVKTIEGALQLINRDRPKLLVEIHDDENLKRIKELLPIDYLIYDPVTRAEKIRPYPDVLFISQ